MTHLQLSEGKKNGGSQRLFISFFHIFIFKSFISHPTHKTVACHLIKLKIDPRPGHKLHFTQLVETSWLVIALYFFVFFSQGSLKLPNTQSWLRNFGVIQQLDCANDWAHGRINWAGCGGRDDSTDLFSSWAFILYTFKKKKENSETISSPAKWN